MALGSTQPLTEMITRNLPGGKGRLARKADNLTAICKPIVCKMWKPRRLTTLWVSTACYRDSFTFTFTGINKICSRNFIMSSISMAFNLFTLHKQQIVTSILRADSLYLADTIH
jgi:hypothetical protein